MDEKRISLASRIIDVDYWGAMDAGATPESVAEDIANDPETVIEYLLDFIDQLQEDVCRTS